MGELEMILNLIKNVGIWAALFIGSIWYFINKYLPAQQAIQQKQVQDFRDAQAKIAQDHKEIVTQLSDTFSKNQDRVITHSEKAQERMSEQFISVTSLLVGKIDGIDKTVKELKVDIDSLKETDTKIVEALDNLSKK